MAEQRRSPREVEGRDPKSPNAEVQTLNQIAEDIRNRGIELTNDGGKWFLKSIADGDNEIFGVIDNAGDYYFLTVEKMRAKYLDNAKKSKGGIEGFRKSLYEANYISEGDFKTKNATAFNAAITNLGRDVANELWSSYESGIAWNTPLTTLLKSKSFGAGDGPTATRTKTTRMDANQDINKFFMELVGFGPTKEQRRQYYDLLDEAESKAIRKSTRVGDTAVVVDTLLDEEDIFEIRTKVLKPALKGTPLEQITAGGGKLAQQISDLKEYASEYGINLSTENALSQVKQQLKRGALKDLSQQQSQIREMSKAFYPNVADLIDKGVSIKDIADQFIQQKASTLDLPKSSISIFDNDIQKALNNTAEDGVTKRQGVMSISQSELMFRENPNFMRTKTAIDEAYSFISQLGRLFGKMA
jgi:hypothetical protein